MTVTTSIDRPQDRVQRGQRIKVGLIGLGAVILLIGLASAVFNSVNRERPVAAIGAAQSARVAEMVDTTDPAATAEPLQELGVAPPAAPPEAAPAASAAQAAQNRH